MVQSYIKQEDDRTFHPEVLCQLLTDTVTYLLTLLIDIVSCGHIHIANVEVMTCTVALEVFTDKPQWLCSIELSFKRVRTRGQRTREVTDVDNKSQ